MSSIKWHFKENPPEPKEDQFIAYLGATIYQDDLTEEMRQRVEKVWYAGNGFWSSDRLRARNVYAWAIFPAPPQRNNIQTMNREHPRWAEFLGRLEGSEGCNLRKDEEGKTIWNCGCVHYERPLAAAILEDMGALTFWLRWLSLIDMADTVIAKSCLTLPKGGK